MDDKELGEARQRARMRNMEYVPGTNERNKSYSPPPPPPPPPPVYKPASSARSSTRQSKRSQPSGNGASQANGLDILIALAGAAGGAALVINNVTSPGWGILIGAVIAGGIAYALRKLVKILIVIGILGGIAWLIFSPKSSAPATAVSQVQQSHDPASPPSAPQSTGVAASRS